MLSQMTGFPSFIRLKCSLRCVCVCACVCVCVCVYHIFFTLSSTDGHLSWFHASLVWMIMQLTWECTYLFNILISFLLHIDSEVRLLDLIIVIFLSFWWNLLLFSIMTVLISIFTNSVQRFPFLHILTLAILAFLTIVYLTVMRSYLIAI
jgi:hypothetical protein